MDGSLKRKESQVLVAQKMDSLKRKESQLAAQIAAQIRKVKANSVYKVGQEVRVRDRGDAEWKRGFVSKIRPELRVKTSDSRYAYVWDEVKAWCAAGQSSIRTSEGRRQQKVAIARSKWIATVLERDASSLRRIFDDIDVDCNSLIDKMELRAYFHRKGNQVL
jgi:hypothetical protein